MTSAGMHIFPEDEKEFLRHDHVSLFFRCSGSHALLPLQKGVPSFPWQSLEVYPDLFSLVQKHSISPIEVLIYRLCHDPFFQNKIQSVWFYIDSTRDECCRDIQFFIQSLRSKNSLYLGIPNIDVIRKQSDAAAARELFLNYDVDDLFFVSTRAMLLDLQIARQMYENHCRYLCEYTYSENVPAGFAGEFAHRSLIYRLGEEDLPAQFSLGEIIRKNINHFDVEVHFQSPDIRVLRADGSIQDARQAEIVSGVIQSIGKLPSYQEFAEALWATPSLYRIHPSYLELEICSDCQLHCLYCPRHYAAMPRDSREMPLEMVEQILAQSSKLGFPLTVALGGMGEPLLHSHFLALLQQLDASDSVERIVLETNGILLTEELVKEILKLKTKVHIIINLNALTKEQYDSLQPKNPEYQATLPNNIFLQLLENLHMLAPYNLDHQGRATDFLTIQLLKISQNETLIDDFFKHWTGKGFQVLLQKQNRYQGLVPDFRFSDLTPLQRIPCWHLSRDLAIASDGAVLTCKQDILKRNVLGSFADSSNEIFRNTWEKNGSLAAQEGRGDYSAFPACEQCDEWYTFNF